MKLLIITSVLAFVSIASFSSEEPSLNIPLSMETATSKEATFSRESLSNDTRVKFSHFSLLAPKGWTVVATGPNKETVNIQTFLEVSPGTGHQFGIGLAERKNRSLASMEQRFEENKNKPGKKTTFKNVNGVRWLEIESHPPSMKMFVSWAVVGNSEFMLTASIPDNAPSPNYEKDLKRLLDSITIK